MINISVASLLGGIAIGGGVAGKYYWNCYKATGVQAPTGRMLVIVFEIAGAFYSLHLLWLVVEPVLFDAESKMGVDVVSYFVIGCLALDYTVFTRIRESFKRLRNATPGSREPATTDD